MPKPQHKRVYRRKRSTLSNYRIATRTSARAQSKQIYALKKRVSRIYRLTKPETQVQIRPSSAITLTSATSGLVNFEYQSPSGITNTDAMVIPNVFRATYSEGHETSGNIPVNNWIRSHNFSLYGNWQYGTVASDNTPLTMRLVIVQTKRTRSDGLNINDVFQGPSTFVNVFGPLQDGITATCKVLSDKRYNLNFQRPNVNVKTGLKYLYNFRRDMTNASGTDSSEGVPAGTIYVFYAVYSPAATPTSSTLNLVYKLAWSDN